MAIVLDAQPGDIYVDENGKLWRVQWVCSQPTIGFEAVEGTPYVSQDDERTALLNKTKKEGGFSGLMFDGFKVIHRPKL